MIFATRPPSRIAPALLLAALFAIPGCQENDGTNVTPADFTAKTTGTPGELAEHLTRINNLYRTADPSSPAASRDLRLAFTMAVIKTTDALMADPKTPAAMRESAMGFQFQAYAQRNEVDPKAEADLLAAATKIETENAGTRLATLAAEQVATVLGIRAQFGPEAESHARYAAAAKATIHAATMEPRADHGAETLFGFANECEKMHFFDLARQADEALVKTYPDSPGTKFAVGAIHRHDLMGKPIDDLEGLGADGKPISIKDFRGKVVLVAFWTGSPQQNLDELQGIEKYRLTQNPKDFAVLGVCLDPKPESTAKVLKELKIDWPQIESKITNEEIESPLNLRYGLKTIVYKFVIDRDGRLVDSGYILEQVRASLDKLLPNLKVISETQVAPKPAMTKEK